MREEFFEKKREQLVNGLKSGGAIKSGTVEKAFLKVKRENFFPKNLQKLSYEDNAFPIGFNQTISQPSTIAVMLEMLKIKKGEKVLEVGSGSGYVLALLSSIAGKNGKVFGTEIVKELFELSKKNIAKEKCKNVKIFLKDGSAGLKESAPFDKIILSAACPFFPKTLFDQLNEMGTGVAPVGDKGTQIMQLITKKNNKPVKTEYLESYFAFVPLLGKEGFKSEF